MSDDNKTETRQVALVVQIGPGNKLRHRSKWLICMVGGERIELSTIRLKVGCSTTELPAHTACHAGIAKLCQRGEPAF